MRTESEIRQKVKEITEDFLDSESDYSLRAFKCAINSLNWALGKEWINPIRRLTKYGAKFTQYEKQLQQRINIKEMKGGNENNNKNENTNQ